MLRYKVKKKTYRFWSHNFLFIILLMYSGNIFPIHRDLDALLLFKSVKIMALLFVFLFLDELSFSPLLEI